MLLGLGPVLLQAWGSLLCVYVQEEVQGESGRASHGGRWSEASSAQPCLPYKLPSVVLNPRHRILGASARQTFNAPSTQPLPQPAFLARPPARPASLPLEPLPSLYTPDAYSCRAASLTFPTASSAWPH